VVSAVIVESVANVANAVSVLIVVSVVLVLSIRSSRRARPIATPLRTRSRRTSATLWITWISKKIKFYYK
jgi:hypothetical protein